MPSYEALVMVVDHTHVDKTKEARGCYKEGDIVLVKESGWKWSDTEKKQFVVVKLADFSAVDPDTYSAPGYKGGVVVLRRKYKFDLSGIIANPTLLARVKDQNDECQPFLDATIAPVNKAVIEDKDPTAMVSP